MSRTFHGTRLQQLHAHDNHREARASEDKSLEGSRRTQETPEFQRQSRDFAAAVTAAGKSATLIVADGYNHFEVMESLGHPYSAFGRAVLGQMRLSPA